MVNIGCVPELELFELPLGFLVTPPVYHIHHSFFVVYLSPTHWNMQCISYPWCYSVPRNTSGISHTPQLPWTIFHRSLRICRVYKYPLGYSFTRNTSGISHTPQLPWSLQATLLNLDICNPDFRLNGTDLKVPVPTFTYNFYMHNPDFA